MLVDWINFPDKVKIQDRDILARDGQALVKMVVCYDLTFWCNQFFFTVMLDDGVCSLPRLLLKSKCPWISSTSLKIQDREDILSRDGQALVSLMNTVSTSWQCCSHELTVSATITLVFFPFHAVASWVEFNCDWWCEDTSEDESS